MFAIISYLNPWPESTCTALPFPRTNEKFNSSNLVADSFHNTGANFCVIVSVAPPKEAHLASERAPPLPTSIDGLNDADSALQLELKCAKRKQLLAAGEDFFGHRTVVERIAPSLRSAFWHASAAQDGSLPNADRLTSTSLLVFGEIFGGFYPLATADGASEATGLMAQAVQTGIWYSPVVEFCVFDMALRSASGDAYLDFQDTLRVCQNSGLLSVPVLQTGTFEEMLAVSPRFVSLVPAMLGLPRLPASGTAANYAEGLVVRPLCELVVGNGGRAPVRALVKHKIPEFAEDARFNQAIKPVAESSISRDRQDRDSSIEYLVSEMLALVNINRVQSAESKIGRVSANVADRARCKQALELVHADCIESFRTSFGDEVDAIRPSLTANEWTQRFAEPLMHACKTEILAYVRARTVEGTTSE